MRQHCERLWIVFIASRMNAHDKSQNARTGGSEVCLLESSDLHSRIKTSGVEMF